MTNNRQPLISVCTNTGTIVYRQHNSAAAAFSCEAENLVHSKDGKSVPLMAEKTSKVSKVVSQDMKEASIQVIE